MTASEHLLGGRYEVGELVGYGGMAEVRRGRDLRLGRDVAVKMLRTDLARDNTFQMRFRREAQNVATLNHPGIAAVYDTGEERASSGEALPYIVMEFVNGHTLKDVLAAEQRLQPRRALEITADICAALEFSHRHGIIHRDVKPGNVMITPNGQVKVMDFGIARDLASGATTMTQTSAVIGTAQYLSPEQARGEAVDARSDVYATGCVLFELLCGHPPFVGDSPVSVAYQHVREDPRAPSELNPEVPPDVDAVVLKALAKNPANRYQSAAEMRADLLRAAAGRPVLATPVMNEAETAMLGQSGGPPARVGDPERRRASTWVLIALGVLGVLAVVALIVGLVLTNASEEDLVQVPGVVGLEQDQAEAQLTEAGFEPEVAQVNGDDCQEGAVVAQDPAADDEVAAGSTVRIEVCAGPELVTIPDGLVGSQLDSARDRLEELGLEVDVERDDSDEPADEVLAVDPPGGDEVEKGSRVLLTVSAGNILTVPNVVGDTAQVATGRLQQEGFEVQELESDEAPTDPAQIGTVAAQDPSGDSSLELGGTVTIYVYQPTADLTVEDPVAEGLQVTLSWDNNIHGDVTIDWGDGSAAETRGASGEVVHTYTLEEGLTEQTFTITVTDADDSSRSRQVDVTVLDPGA